MRAAAVYIRGACCICLLAASLGVHGYLPRATTQASPAPSSSASATRGFGFNIISEMTTCTPAKITWVYSPLYSINLAISITNAEVSQPDPPLNALISSHMIRAWNRNSVSRRGVITQLIAAESLNPLARSYTWPSVNVSAGWYTLQASFDSALPIQSTPFYVVNGTDISCIRTTAVSVSTSAATSASSSARGPSATIGVAKVHGSKVNRGEIAGGVAGGLFILVAMIVVIRCRYRTRTAPIIADIPPISPGARPAAAVMPAAVTLSLDRGKTVLVWDRPIAPSVVESQEEMLEKLARMHESMRMLEREASDAAVHTRDELQDGGEEVVHLLDESASDPASEAHVQAPSQPVASLSGDRGNTPDIAQQLRAMAERLALMEAHLQTHGFSAERPPDYTVGLPP
ncbi:hypothetical protein DFH09DRAFT_1288024 [Mycena vulgaris]|nr:hypothetical protein DFH09DRAFT_1288024 [Mycena vulgaris]